MVQTLSRELARLRKMARLSQQELADLSGVSRGTVRNIESGTSQPLPETLRLLARGLATNEARVLDAELARGYFRELLIAGDFPLENADVVKMGGQDALPPIPLAGRITRTEDLDLPVYRSHAGRLIIADPTPIDHWRIRADRTYTVEVVGNCLFGQDINEGDRLIVDRERQPSNGRIVVVRIGDETFLTRWKKLNGMVELEMSDGQFREALVHDLDVQGVVTNVIKPAP